MASMTADEQTVLGMDVHRDSISVGFLEPAEETPAVERVCHDEASVRG